ncbi:MAG: diheme cytochrome c [Vitreoscilla sp.]|nr:diheme cytochrome c [Vitreoscilla sp.]MBP6677315.1 diheme cytochrome c [Vitreoscilla sp.]
MHTPSLFAAMLLAAATLAHADDHGRRVAPNPSYVKECSDCHVAFPVQMLTAASWSRLMGKLPRHFGSDASLDPATTSELTSWLTTNAGTPGKRATENPPEDRITRSAWFVRKHDEVAAGTWQRPAIKSAANCAACHPRAADGNYNERDIRIPK